MVDTSVARTSDKIEQADKSNANLNSVDRLALLSDYSKTVPAPAAYEGDANSDYLSFSDPYKSNESKVGGEPVSAVNPRTDTATNSGAESVGGGGGGSADKAKSQVPEPPDTFDGNMRRNSKGQVTEVNYSNGQKASVYYDGSDPRMINLPYGHELNENHPDPSQKTNKGVNSADAIRTYTEQDSEMNDLPGRENMAAGITKDGSLIVVNGDDATAQVRYSDNSTDSYDAYGDLTQHMESDGKETNYHYEKGLLTGVTDSDHVEWTRGADGKFTQLDGNGEPTTHTESADKFLPPTSDTSLYEKSDDDSYNSAYKDLDSIIQAHSGAGVGKAGVDASGVVQGGIGDCYFEASVASLAHEDPQAIKNMIQDNNNGTYTVTFPGDKTHPVTVEAPTAEEMARFGADENGSWAAVLEKAHRYSTYSSPAVDQGDNPATALQTLTGKDFKDTQFHPGDSDNGNKVQGASNNHKSKHTPAGPSDAEIGDTIENSLSKHEPVVAYTHQKTDMVPQHAYSVLDYDAADKTVTVRNPWGKPGFDEHKIKSLKDLGDGEFSMPLDQFRKEFAAMDTEKD